MRTQYETLPLTEAMTEAAADLIRNHSFHPSSVFWVNIEPDVDKRDIHTGSIFWKAFSSRGPVIPRFTWVSATTSRGSFVPAQIGLTHPTGNVALERLKNFDALIPKEWGLQQDHPKRGLVFQLPKKYDVDEVIGFALRSIPILSPFEFKNKFILFYPKQ
tara:strand:- start:145 stop:624 length:480 start_codon:yes stop_codon:yes gene_type:complete